MRIEYMQMHHGMQQLGTAVTLPACGLPYHSPVLIHNREYLLLIIFHIQAICSSSISKIIVKSRRFCIYSFGSIILISLAGLPTTMALAGTSLVTTAAAATTAFSPTVTPGRMVAPAPIHAFLQI